MERFIKLRLKGGRFHAPSQSWTRTDIVLTGQTNRGQAQHIASIHGAKLLSFKKVPTPKWIREHNAKMFGRH
jgi:hypothetical protein